MTRKEPRWVTPFLRALERTGKVYVAAEDAGVDRTTAFARRKVHAEFALAWEEALKAHAAAKKRAEDEEIEAVRADPAAVLGPSTIQSSLDGPPPRAELGEDFVISGGQVKRAGYGRWSKRKEKIFFEELAASNNIQRSAAAAGVSTNAVHARRMKHPVFAAKWEAVAQAARASINMHLLEETRKSFDPDQLDTGEVQPKVSIDQAIKIAQMDARKAQRGAVEDPFEAEAAAMGKDEADALREKLIAKLGRLRERAMRERLEQGWSLDESYDHPIPPGWVKGPDYRPRDGEEPGASD